MGDEHTMENKKKGKKIKIFLLAMGIVAAGTGSLFLGDRLIKPHLMPSPFNGSEINIDVDELNESAAAVYEVVKPQMNTAEIEKYVKENLSNDEKKGVLLLSALHQNPFVNDEELRAFAGFIQYANDNKYLDYERIYKSFLNLWVFKNQNLDGPVGTYSSLFNIVRLEELSALYHELFHAEEHVNNYTYNNEVQLWFSEGFSEVLCYEYVLHQQQGYSVECAAIRIITELVGADKMLEARGKQSVEIVVNALLEKGVDKSTITQLFTALNDYNFKNNSNNQANDDEAIQEVIAKISNLLIMVYNQVYNTPEVVSPTFIYNLDLLNKRILINLEEVNYYLFNSALKKRYPILSTNPSNELVNIKSDKDVRERPVAIHYEYEPNKIVTYMTLKDDGNRKVKIETTYGQSDLDKYKTLSLGKHR